MTYEEIAPIVSGAGIAQSAVENYFANLPAPAEPKPEPTVTKPKIVTIADTLYSGEDFAISKLASQVDLSVGQVKTIIKEIKALQAAYNANQED